MKKQLSTVLLAAFACLSLLVCSTDAQVDPDHYEFKGLGKAGFAFLKIGQGARPVAMGDAFVAVADDINAIFWNPAGLAHLNNFQFTASHIQWFVNTQIYSGAVGIPLPRGVLGVSLITFSPDDFEERTILKPTGTGRIVTSNSAAVGLAYALKLTDRLSFGLHTRWIRETFDLDSKSALDVSVGTHFQTGFRSARVAMSFRNFGKDYNVIEEVPGGPEAENFQMPLSFNIATAMEAYGVVGDPTYLTLAVESVYSIDYSQRAHVGAELWLANTVALRGGYKFNYDAEGFSAGVGFKVKRNDRRLTVDFAYTDTRGTSLDAPIRFTIGGAF